MFEFQGMWLPDGEKHFPEWMAKSGEIVDGRGTYQIRKWRACAPWIKTWRTAIDVGAHVGFWSIQMAKGFQKVHAFEPVAQFRECFARNVTGVDLYPCALGAADGFVSLSIPDLDGGIDSGGTHVSGAGDIPLKTLDSFAFEDVDFVKIDCEGYEHQVIEGGRETFKRWKPCVIVEQKPHKLGQNFGIKGTPAVDLLLEMGAVLRKEIGGDYIMSWD